MDKEKLREEYYQAELAMPENFERVSSEAISNWWIKKINEAVAEERERVVGEVIKVIVSEYNSATNSYKIAKMNVEKGKKWAEADCISENSKQVVLSRLEPKISSLLSSLQE